MQTRKPGWDAQIISKIANDVFGDYERMLIVHGWDERGPDMMRKVQSRVKDTYGSIDRFAKTFAGITGHR